MQIWTGEESCFVSIPCLRTPSHHFGTQAARPHLPASPADQNVWPTEGRRRGCKASLQCPVRPVGDERLQLPFELSLDAVLHCPQTHVSQAFVGLIECGVCSPTRSSDPYYAIASPASSILSALPPQLNRICLCDFGGLSDALHHSSILRKAVRMWSRLSSTSSTMSSRRTVLRCATCPIFAKLS